MSQNFIPSTDTAFKSRSLNTPLSHKHISTQFVLGHDEKIEVQVKILIIVEINPFQMK